MLYFDEVIFDRVAVTRIAAPGDQRGRDDGRPDDDDHKKRAIYRPLLVEVAGRKQDEVTVAKHQRRCATEGYNDIFRKQLNYIQGE